MAKARNSGRKRSGWRRVTKAREVKPDGAYAYTWTYQAKLADALAAARDRERTAEAQQDAEEIARKTREEKTARQSEAQAQRQARLSPRPCLRCGEVLPPEAFEPHYRAYNGRMGCCRPCARLIRDRKAAPVGRRKPDLPPRACRHCARSFAAQGKRLYCSDECRQARQRAAANDRRRADYQARPEAYREAKRIWTAANPEKRRMYRRRAYHARPEIAKEAHAVWVARNRLRVNAYVRQWRRGQSPTWRIQTNAAQTERRQRRQAIVEAKTEFAWQGFLLVRARSGFWRGAAEGKAIGRTETVMACYVWTDDGWCVSPPVLGAGAMSGVAARLRRGEEQQRKTRKKAKT